MIKKNPVKGLYYKDYTMMFTDNCKLHEIINYYALLIIQKLIKTFHKLLV